MMAPGDMVSIRGQVMEYTYIYFWIPFLFIGVFNVKSIDDVCRDVAILHMPHGKDEWLAIYTNGLLLSLHIIKFI